MLVPSFSLQTLTKKVSVHQLIMFTFITNLHLSYIWQFSIHKTNITVPLLAYAKVIATSRIVYNPNQQCWFPTNANKKPAYNQLIMIRYIANLHPSYIWQFSTTVLLLTYESNSGFWDLL